MALRTISRAHHEPVKAGLVDREPAHQLKRGAAGRDLLHHLAVAHHLPGWDGRGRSVEVAILGPHREVEGLAGRDHRRRQHGETGELDALDAEARPLAAHELALALEVDVDREQEVLGGGGLPRGRAPCAGHRWKTTDRRAKRTPSSLNAGVLRASRYP